MRLCIILIFRFTPKKLIDKVTEDGYEFAVVIDLTNTFRYYNGAVVSYTVV